MTRDEEILRQVRELRDRIVSNNQRWRERGWPELVDTRIEWLNDLEAKTLARMNRTKETAQ